MQFAIGSCPWSTTCSPPFHVLQRFNQSVRSHHQWTTSCLHSTITKASKKEDAFDVSRSVIQPSYRSTPWKSNEENQKLCIVFVSESNVCRSILAESMMMDLLSQSGLDSFIHCESRATRDYNIGEGPDPAVIEASDDLSIFLNEDKKAELFDYEKDIVLFDLVLVMDKFTAADVLREVSVYDTIQKETRYSAKVRRLGEFHPKLKLNEDVDGQDIDDPLYGNYGGESTKIQVEEVAKIIEGACLGLLTYFQSIEKRADNDAKSFKKFVEEDVVNMECIDWLVPPMLQSKQQ